jgi:mRNA (2'-O-methyladenosine-N6-)-methyltransferase
MLTLALLSVCRLVDEVVWVKMTVNRRLFKSHGYYLQHAKEVCLVARKNPSPQQQQQQQQIQQQQQPWQQQVQQQHAGRQAQFPEARGGFFQGQCGVGGDIIFSERRGQSQKPEEIYELIESLVPNGEYAPAAVAAS